MSFENSFFRRDAMRSYRQSQSQPVFPRLVAPKGFLFLWVLLGLLVIASSVSWAAQVPLFASGFAVVIETEGGPGQQLLIVLPAQYLPSLHRGQKVVIELLEGRAQWVSTISSVVPEVQPPGTVESNFVIPACAVSRMGQPVALSLAKWEPIGEGSLSADYVGSIYDARVEVGARRLISFLPGL